jgi:hypothetical protein
MNKQDYFNKGYNYYRNGQNAEALSLGFGFLIEFPIIAVILFFLSIIFGVVIFSGLIGLTVNYYFYGVFGLLLLLLIFESKYILQKPMLFTILFSVLFTLIMISTQVYINPSCTTSILGGLLCGGYEILAFIPNILYYFVPCFIALGSIVFIRRIL